jgi:methyltransferase (TIGR00027 family)
MSQSSFGYRHKRSWLRETGCVLSGEASRTARAVAGVRVGAERVPASYGDPAADDRLQQLVAGSAAGLPSTAMSRYLIARTQFFDAQVVAALDSGITQVVVAAAGYDGRALRYAKRGVRWLELDHPATQADKLTRLAQLGIDTGHIRFVAADFIDDDVAGQLATGGCDPTQRTLVLAEGIAVYLSLPVLTGLLRALRASVAHGSRLVLSVSVDLASPGQADRRAAFQQRVAALGEPAPTVLTADDAQALLTVTGWHADYADPAASERARSAGFIVASAAVDSSNN